MIRANTDWYSSTRDDANPIYEDEIRPREFTSTRARVAFSIFRYLCFIVLYGVLAFAALFIVLSLYGFAHFRLFQDMVSECLAENHAKAKVFAKHHVYRLAFQMTYGLSALAFCLIATRVSRFKPPVKVSTCFTKIIIIIVIILSTQQSLINVHEFPSVYHRAIRCCVNPLIRIMLILYIL